MMSKVKFLFLATLLFYSWIAPAPATEIDSFTLRYREIKDATSIVNALTNKSLERAAERANLQRNGCQKLSLYRHLHAVTGGFFWSRLEKKVENHPQIEKLHLHRSKSIYRYIRPLQASALYMAALGSTLKMGPYTIGTDKLGHFIDTGYRYFQRAFLWGQGESAAMGWGEHTERGFYGMQATGVWSYGDLVANYNGMRFWQELVGEGVGMVGRGVGASSRSQVTAKPYFACVAGKWKKVRSFDWMDYIDAGWDEGINCNKYKNASIARKIDKILMDLQLKNGEKYLCPIVPEECPSLLAKYGVLAPRLITPYCFSK